MAFRIPGMTKFGEAAQAMGRWASQTRTQLSHAAEVVGDTAKNAAGALQNGARQIKTGSQKVWTRTKEINNDLQHGWNTASQEMQNGARPGTAFRRADTHGGGTPQQGGSPQSGQGSTWNRRASSYNSNSSRSAGTTNRQQARNHNQQGGSQATGGTTPPPGGNTSHGGSQQPTGGGTPPHQPTAAEREAAERQREINELRENRKTVSEQGRHDRDVEYENFLTRKEQKKWNKKLEDMDKGFMARNPLLTALGGLGVGGLALSAMPKGTPIGATGMLSPEAAGAQAAMMEAGYYADPATQMRGNTGVNGGYGAQPSFSINAANANYEGALDPSLAQARG